MKPMTLEELLTVLFVLVDEWYQAEGKALLKGKVGRKPIFTDSEVMTLMIGMDLLPFPSERGFLAYMRAHYHALFPKLQDQSQFNRRARGLYRPVEVFRQEWVKRLGGMDELDFLVDTKPISVVGFKHYKGHSNFLGYADYGYCTSRGLHYFGYKLVMTSTLDGLPVLFDLVPARTDEREAAQAVVGHLFGCEILGDKGFIGKQWQGELFHKQHTRIFTPSRSNQKVQFPKAFTLWMQGKRERIDGVFNEVQNTGRDIESLLTKTRWGLFTRVVSRLTSQVMKDVLRQRFGLDPLTFSSMHA